MLNEVDPAVNRYTASGSNPEFAYTFKISDATHIGIYLGEAVQTTGFTVTGVGNSAGGSVIFGSNPLNGTIVTLLRKQPASQLSDYIPNEAVPAERIEADLDKLVMQIQQVREQLKRGFFLSKSSALVDQGIDVPVDGLFARGKSGGGIDWATPTLASPASLPISVANGGTGSTTGHAYIDAQGDSLWGTANDTLARLAAGNDGDILIVDKAQSTGMIYQQLRPLSFAPNPFFAVDQLANSATSVADDNYGHDHWYVLTQTASIQVSTQTDQENGTPTNTRLTQNQAAAQRMGYACILESSEAKKLRGKTVTFNPRVRTSSGQSIMAAILEWTGTANAVTSDIVNDWTSTDFTDGAAKFFVDANITPLGNDSVTPSAGTWQDNPLGAVTIGSSCNNIILFIWTFVTASQSVTLDISRVRLVLGTYKGEIHIPTFHETMFYARRFFQKSFPYATAPAQNAGDAGADLMASPFTAASLVSIPVTFQTPMISSIPTVTTYNPGAANAQMRNTTDAADDSGTGVGTSERGLFITATANAANTVGDLHRIHWTASARL